MLFLKKDIFFLCISITACSVPSAVMDGTCLIQFVSQHWFVFLAEGNEIGGGWEKK